MKTPQKFFSVIALAFLGLSLAGCASGRPILDENAKMSRVGEERAERDIDECLARADKYLARHKSDIQKKEVIKGAAGGAVVGGLIGALSGKGLGAAAGGAALGAGVGASSSYVDNKMVGVSKEDHLKNRYVENCLKRKDYDVIGWK